MHTKEFKVAAIYEKGLWLAPRAGKITQIVHCDWLPERASCPLGTTRCIPQ